MNTHVLTHPTTPHTTPTLHCTALHEREKRSSSNANRVELLHAAEEIRDEMNDTEPFLTPKNVWWNDKTASDNNI
jgi:hypothetical protein